MARSSPAFLKQMFNASLAIGEKAISADATMVIEGHEEMTLLIKQFPWPTLSTAGEIEVFMPLGSSMWQQQQLKTAQSGQLTLMETKVGHVQSLQERLLVESDGYFNAKVYEGTEDNFSRELEILHAFMRFDNPDRDFENRGQLLLMTGEIFYQYFANA